MSTSPLLLLPAAGYGRRAGSPLSKEMLPDSNGRPLIEYWLDLALDLGWDTHLLTREEKTNLIDFVRSRQSGQKIHLQIVSPTRDYPETLLQSQNFWSEYNIVGLPDTRFAPHAALKHLATLLQQVPSAYATIDQENAHEFGGLLLEEQCTGIFEKCAPPAQKKIWCLMGFQKSVGERVLQAHMKSTIAGQPEFLEWMSKEAPLDYFEDLTRNGF